MSDYISRHAALDALGVTKNATKYGGDHSGYDTRMLYEIHDALTGISAADVISKADMLTMLEETEKEITKGVEASPTGMMIKSVFGVIKCKVNMMGEKTDG